MNQDPTGQMIKRAALLVVAQAQRDGATDLVLTRSSDGGTSMRYQINGTWRNWTPAPGLIWPLLLSELGGLAGIRQAPFPKQGIIYVAYSGLRLRWHLKMTNQNDECSLRNLGTQTI